MYKADKDDKKIILGIVSIFIAGTFVSFITLLLIEHEDWASLDYLLIASGSTSLFWLLSSILIFIQKKKYNLLNKPADILIISIVLLVPLSIYLLISGIDFRIGG